MTTTESVTSTPRLTSKPSVTSGTTSGTSTTSGTTKIPVTTSRTTEYIKTTIAPIEHDSDQEPEEPEESEDDKTEISELNTFIDEVSDFSNNINLYKFTSIKDIFKALKKKDDATKMSLLFNYLSDTLKANIEYIRKDFDSIQKTEKNLKNLKELKNKYEKTTKQLKEEISLDERNYEYSVSEYNKMVFETNLLKYFLIFVIFLFVIPILKLTSIISGNVATILYFTCLFLGICASVYVLYQNSEYRDNVFYNVLNFPKPEDNNSSSSSTQTCKDESNESNESNEASD